MNEEQFTSVISRQMNNFFERHWMLTKANQPSNEVVLNKHLVRCILNAVYFVRLQVNSSLQK